jgi:hypothetical protein
VADYTWTSVLSIYALMGLLVVATAVALVRAIRSGAVADDEAPKFRMLHDDEPCGRER